MRLEILMLLLGMMAVTYIPRMLPFLLLNIDRVPRAVRKTFALIQVTALGALIIPGLFEAVSSFVVPGVAGIIVAGLVAWRSKEIVLPVAAAVLITYLLTLGR
jgi:branched-subunit amino acid transport protein